MPICLEAEYDSVIRTLHQYAAYAATIRKRIYFRVWVLGSERVHDELLDQWVRDLSPLAPSSTPAMRKLIQRFANKDEQSSPFYDVMLSDYPLETLALQIEAAHPDLNFAQIAKLYELREKQLWWGVNFKVVITGALGIGLFFLNTVPDALLNKLWPIEFPNGTNFAELFDVLVFFFTVVLVVLIIIFWLFYWFHLGRWLHAVRHSVRAALGYLAIRQARSIAQPDATVDRP